MVAYTSALSWYARNHINQRCATLLRENSARDLNPEVVSSRVLYGYALLVVIPQLVLRMAQQSDLGERVGRAFSLAQNDWRKGSLTCCILGENFAGRGGRGGGGGREGAGGGGGGGGRALPCFLYGS